MTDRFEIRPAVEGVGNGSHAGDVGGAGYCVWDTLTDAPRGTPHADPCDAELWRRRAEGRWRAVLVADAARVLNAKPDV